MIQKTPLICYAELLEQLENAACEKHLLLGNGFNVSLGINTGYKNIFEEMVKEETVYEKIKEQMENKGFDIEKLIGHLEDCCKEEVPFLKSYIARKVKFDFMKAASNIVQKEVKEIYQDKNQEISLLFKNFNNYFTLNYDPFLYLLLMKFKKSYDVQEPQSMAFQNSFNFQSADWNNEKQDIYDFIKNAKENGTLTISTGVDETPPIRLDKVNKSQFLSSIEIHCHQHNSKWTKKDIAAVCDQLLKEEKSEAMLEKNEDGFCKDRRRRNLTLFQDNLHKNVFFLHGCFHIYQNKQFIRKITQTQNKAFLRHLEEAIQSEDHEKEIICVLTSDSESKKEQIDNNKYLKNCFEHLKKLSGHIVIFGSSLDGNDKHIFQAINESEIEKIYISSSRRQKEENWNKAKGFFPGKEVVLFDYKTISYAIQSAETKQ